MKHLLILLISITVLSCQLDSLTDYTPKGNRYALVIGVSYEGLSLVIDTESREIPLELNATKKDATEIGKALKQYGYTVTELVSSETYPLTKDKIIGDLEVWSLSGDDQVVVFFAGHGEIVRGTHYLLMERDTYSNSFNTWEDWYDDVEEHDFSSRELLDELASLGVPAVLLLDACVSGGFIPGDPHSHDRLGIWWDEKEEYPKAESIRRSLNTFFFFPEKTYEPEHIWVMSAAGSDEDAREGIAFDEEGGGGDHGAFTYMLLQGLSISNGYASGDANRDGVLLLSELYADVIQSFQKHAQTFGSRMYYPRLSGSPRDIILGKTK